MPLHKIADGETFWHRMGDVGYLEPASGGIRRRAVLVLRPQGASRHHGRAARCSRFPAKRSSTSIRAIYRSALVGVGPPGEQRPVIIVEPWPEQRPQDRSRRARRTARRTGGTRRSSIRTRPRIRDFFLHRCVAGRYPPQRQDLPREAGRLGGEEAGSVLRSELRHEIVCNGNWALGMLSVADFQNMASIGSACVATSCRLLWIVSVIGCAHSEQMYYGRSTARELRQANRAAVCVDIANLPLGIIALGSIRRRSSRCKQFSERPNGNGVYR